MLLEGSCHCGHVRFSVQSQAAVPYQHCYCSICRKTGGSGGYMINLGADASTLEVEGSEFTKAYSAQIVRDGEMRTSRHQRIFCGECGSHLWAFNERWPELVHPVASAIDTPLPVATERCHMMIASKANWVVIPDSDRDRTFENYPEESLTNWHEARGITT